ncbi:dimethylaniline monooxygenase [Fusarium oxysporum f. sp. phaseoli]
MGFIGFVRPSLGAIPPLAEMQAQSWVLNLLTPHKLKHLKPDDEAHYRLHCRPDARVTYGVDHESYADQLTLDMNSAPGITDILNLMRRSGIRDAYRLLVLWAFGAHFNAKFRLVGPWAWEHAQGLLVSGEFWQTITRRPIIFGKLPPPGFHTSLIIKTISFFRFCRWLFSIPSASCSGFFIPYMLV